MNLLPYENLLNIALNIPYEELSPLCNTNKTFHKLCNDPYFWSIKAQQDFDVPSEEFYLNLTNPRERYFRYYLEYAENNLVPYNEVQISTYYINPYLQGISGVGNKILTFIDLNDNKHYTRIMDINELWPPQPIVKDNTIYENTRILNQGTPLVYNGTKVNLFVKRLIERAKQKEGSPVINFLFIGTKIPARNLEEAILKYRALQYKNATPNTIVDVLLANNTMISTLTSPDFNWSSAQDLDEAIDKYIDEAIRMWGIRIV